MSNNSGNFNVIKIESLMEKVLSKLAIVTDDLSKISNGSVSINKLIASSDAMLANSWDNLGFKASNLKKEIKELSDDFKNGINNYVNSTINNQEQFESSMGFIIDDIDGISNQLDSIFKS